MGTIELCSGKALTFLYEKECKSGIKKIADKLRKDVEAVLGFLPEVSETEGGKTGGDGIRLVFGIAGESPLLAQLEKEDKIALSALRGKREVYGFFPLPAEQLIVIAGSDKRGTIYGLFHLSELLGVSPFVNWSLVVPAKKEALILDEKSAFLSKEPSVEYRGFFINDEWPCFGNWCNKRFGGFNAEMYEGVFELLLRLKGNYLWPAMWTSCFAEDGPGLASAILADELGVVMGLSHHEPCLRHGEEYSHVRGKDSIYGDAWNFRSNKEGITRFWRDGLKRNGHLENVITVGMRGERDSTILGKEATLKDNIDLLRDVLRTQEQLIREEVNEDLSKVPRMLALYKEVEAYYYGDETTPGLREGCEELEDVILMLCDDNHGYVRSLPDEKMRKHPGGFGMYYHFDYHGGPVSYEWICSTHLPEVWEQMTTAYEHGIKKLWIVNVGDLGLQELPLNYFLDLAYDYEKWGITAPNSTKGWLRDWMKRQFGAAFDASELDELSTVWSRAMRLIHNRRPEHLNDTTYSLFEDHEAERVFREAEELEERCLKLKKKCPAEYADAFTELISYNILSGLNLIKLWILRAHNHCMASIGLYEANRYGEEIRRAMEKDRALSEELHTAAGGKWYGFGLAEHIGFRRWNQEERVNPVIETVLPMERTEALVGIVGQPQAVSGGEWTGHRLEVHSYYTNDETEAECSFYIGLKGGEKLEYEVCEKDEFLKLSCEKGVLDSGNPLNVVKVHIDKKAAAAAEEAKLRLRFTTGSVDIVFKELAQDPAEKRRIVLLSDEYAELAAGKGGEFAVLEDLGRRENALKRFPAVGDLAAEDAPEARYEFSVKEEGDHHICFQLEPCNPYRQGKRIKLAYRVNGVLKETYVISESYVAGESGDWGRGVLDHARYVRVKERLAKGKNTVSFVGTEAENVLERIWVSAEDIPLPGSYMGG
ncbi:MAG: glycosyl hydrolase 115 family protein [Lachnospiraceae bacterium]|nr:glycosyl hydrolase 115 family protein [Lachnospiraceae bacterium]